MTPEKQRIAIAEACGKQVLPIVEESPFYEKFERLDSYVKECRSVGRDVDGGFWERVKPDILDGSFPHTLIDGRSSHKLQYLTQGWVHTTARNPLGLWILGGCSQAFDKEPKPEEGREGFAVQVWCAKDVPDYLNSLDAMHEAEKTLRLSNGRMPSAWYMNIRSTAPEPEVATATQRAEAFLHALNLWVED